MTDFVVLGFGVMLGVAAAATWQATRDADQHREVSRQRDLLNIAEGRVQDLEQRLRTAVETAYRLGSAAAKSWAKKNYPHWTDDWSVKK